MGGTGHAPKIHYSHYVETFVDIILFLKKKWISVKCGTNFQNTLNSSVYYWLFITFIFYMYWVQL